MTLGKETGNAGRKRVERAQQLRTRVAIRALAGVEITPRLNLTLLGRRGEHRCTCNESDEHDHLVPLRRSTFLGSSHSGAIVAKVVRRAGFEPA